jgi:hypothetical protein
VKTPFFFDILDFQASGADISALHFKYVLVEKKLFAIMEGYFSALAVKRIGEKSKKRSTLAAYRQIVDNITKVFL